jgi:hypothetical protein
MTLDSSIRRRDDGGKSPMFSNGISSNPVYVIAVAMARRGGRLEASFELLLFLNPNARGVASIETHLRLSLWTE